MTGIASLITLRLTLDIEIARSCWWDAVAITRVPGVNRAGDLTTRIVEYPGTLANIVTEGFSPHSAAGHALSHELHDVIQRRVRLWIAEIPTEQLARLCEALSGDVIYDAGQPRNDYTPIALSPLELLERWAIGIDEQREFMRVAITGLGTLVTSSHATHASRAIGTSIIECSALLRLCCNPKFIAYVTVLVYSMARTVPVMYIPHFHDDWRTPWVIDMIAAIPYAWDLIEIVAGQKPWHRVVGTITAAIIFVAPYVYFLVYGHRAPPGVWTVIALTFLGGIFLGVFRYQRGRTVKKDLAEQL